MISNDLTLNVDYLNDGNTTAEAYERSETYQNRSVFVGDSHQLDARDTMSFYRSFPTKNGNFKGTAKSSVKLTRDVDVTGVDGVATLTSPIIVEASFSIPVGATAADVLKARQRMIAILDTDVVMDDLNTKLLV